MNLKLPLLLVLSTSFACRNASVKLDENDGDVTEDTGLIDTDIEDTGVEDTGTIEDTGVVIDTGDTDPVDTGDTDPVDTGDTDPVDTGDTSVDPNDVDDDNDGFTENDGDCDDADPLVNPNAQEIANDGIDNDCIDGDANNDVDGDGFPTQDDCDDNDPTVGALQDWYLDFDGDSFGSTIIPPTTACTAPVDGNGNQFSSNSLDCDDSSASIYPGATEVWYDGIDQDCDAATEYDQDGDGFNIDALDCDGDGTTESACDLDGDGVDDFVGGGDCNDNDATSLPTDVDGDGVSVCAGDCDDNNATVYPGATEVYWDFLDNDCDGAPDYLTRGAFTGRIEGDGNSDGLGFDNAINLTDIDGDGALDITIGGAFISSTYSGGVLFADNTSRTWDNSATWDDAMTSFADKEIAGHQYNWLSNVPRTFGNNSGDGNPDVALTGTDIFNGSGGDYDIAGALYFDYANINSNEDMGDNADITFSNSLSAFTGTRIYNQFDFNGDGTDDVIFTDFIGARLRQTWQGTQIVTDEGSNSCSGDCGRSALGLYDGSNIANGTWTGDIDVQNSHDAYIEAVSNFDYLGMAVNGADIDGDGDDDMLITAPGSSENADHGGCVYFIKGYGGLDLNNFDGLTFNTSLFTGGPFGAALDGALICSTSDDAWFGWNATPQIADFNGDGLMDLAIGSPSEDKVYLYMDLNSLSGVVDATADADLIIDGNRSFGYSLGTADLNGDGLMDLLIGAPDIDNVNNMFEDPGLFYDLNDGGNGGRIYIFSGASLTAGATLTSGDAQGRIITGDDYFFGSDIVTGDMNGDGKDDIFVTEPLWSSNGNDQEGAVYYYVTP